MDHFLNIVKQYYEKGDTGDASMVNVGTPGNSCLLGWHLGNLSLSKASEQAPAASGGSSEPHATASSNFSSDASNILLDGFQMDAAATSAMLTPLHLSSSVDLVDHSVSASPASLVEPLDQKSFPVLANSESGQEQPVSQPKPALSQPKPAGLQSKNSAVAKDEDD